MRRRRASLAIAFPIVVAAGIASRAFPELVPAAFGKYPGDALWALMVFVVIALLRPNLPPARLALLALATAGLVELSQLYQAPWINAIRATRLGHAALGSGFHAPDFLAYAAGVLLGVALDWTVFCRSAARRVDTACR